MASLRRSTLGVLLLGTAFLIGSGGCNKTGSRGKSAAAKWIDDPSAATAKEGGWSFDALGVKFETPETLYVYRDCGEASHTPDSMTKWIPIVTCVSTAPRVADFGDGEDVVDEFAEDEAEEASGVENVDLTFFVTHRTRPLDERSVTWFRNKYKQSGLRVDKISYQNDYQNGKNGIYAKLHVVDDEGNPTREITQFMFSKGDVVFIARTEYPFGDSRPIEKDWEYLLWNFSWGS